MLALLVRLAGAAPTRRELPGPLVAGGSRADDVHLPGCPAAALRLVPCPAGVVVEAATTGIRAAGRPVAPGGRRLLRAGDAVALQGAALEVVAAPAPEETRAAAAALVRDAAAGAAAPAGLHLVVLTGPSAGARHPLRAVLTLGRGGAASIVLPDPAASRVHARLTLGTGGARIEDLRSKNGVRVNGVRIDRRPVHVRAGDELTIGETLVALAEGAPCGAATRAGSAPRPRGRRAPLAIAALLAVSAAALALAAG
jgi:ribosome-associated protein YbcJ (S4-like RNA binding protein)